MRISSIEFFRTTAIFAVIALHSSPFKESNSAYYQALNIGIDNATRFAVPFFFIVAGYFFGRKILSGSNPSVLLVVYIKRLLPLFLLWSAIYMILPTNIKKQGIKYGLLQATYQKIYGILSDPITLFFLGGRSHLWFLMSLLISLGIITLFIRLNKRTWIIPTALLLCLFAIITGPYSKTPFGIAVSFDIRNTPFFSTPFVVIGWCLSSTKYKLMPVLALALAIIGFSMHMCETFLLWKFYLIPPLGHDYLVGTFLWATGLTMFLLLRPTLFEGNLITQWGQYTLGIYLLHLLVLDMLTPLDKIIPFPLWDIIFPFIVFFISLLIVSVLSKNNRLKYIVAY